MRSLISAVLLCGLAACGSSDDGGGSSDGGHSDAVPACSDAWVAGETLPEDYSGCTNADGSLEAAVTQDCTDGTKFTGYQDRFWAVLGGVIKDSGSEGGTTDDSKYARDYDACFSD